MILSVVLVAWLAFTEFEVIKGKTEWQWGDRMMSVRNYPEAIKEYEKQGPEFHMSRNSCFRMQRRSISVKIILVA